MTCLLYSHHAVLGVVTGGVKDNTIYTDVLAHKVITADINGHPCIEVGSGEALSLDGYKKHLQHLSNHLESVRTECTTVYVTDVACGKIKMVSPLNGTISQLQNMRKLYTYACCVHVK